MLMTKEVDIKFSHTDSGNCRVYYRTVESNQLICKQEETKDNYVWYSCIDDGCWQEPDYVISLEKYNLNIVGG